MENTNQRDSTEKSKDFDKSVKSTFKIYESMDTKNKKALEVMATQGADAAVKHMFTDQDSGCQLSYADMRMRYG